MANNERLITTKQLQINGHVSFAMDGRSFTQAYKQHVEEVFPDAQIVVTGKPIEKRMAEVTFSSPSNSHTVVFENKIDPDTGQLLISPVESNGNSNVGGFEQLNGAISNPKGVLTDYIASHLGDNHIEVSAHIMPSYVVVFVHKGNINNI